MLNKQLKTNGQDVLFGFKFSLNSLFVTQFEVVSITVLIVLSLNANAN